MSLSSPVLNEAELEALQKNPSLKPQVLRTFFEIRKGIEGSLEKALYRLCEAADDAVRSGSQLLILSDRSEELVSSLPCIYMADHFAFRPLFNVLFINTDGFTHHFVSTPLLGILLPMRNSHI